MEVMNNTPFLAFTRIALNNWHYISRKVLSLNREINFLPAIPEAENPL